MRQPKIFLASADQTSLQSLMQILQREGYAVVGVARDGGQALRLIHTLQPDLVILDSELTGTGALEVARFINEEQVAPIIMLASFWHRNIINKARDFPVFAYLVKPIQETTLLPAVEAALANYEKIMRLEKELNKLKETLAARKVIERAKGILMETLGLTEAEAYRRIQKQSMDRCVPMRAIAEAIIVAHELQTGQRKKEDTKNS